MVGYDKNGPKLNTFQYALAGGLSSSITRACISPLDIVKIRMQLGSESIQEYKHSKETKIKKLLKSKNHNHHSNLNLSSFLPQNSSNILSSSRRQLSINYSYQNIPISLRLRILGIQCSPTCLFIFKNIYRNEGIQAFWKGHVAAQCMGITYGIIQLPIFEFITKKSSEKFDIKKTGAIQALICGGFAAGITQFIVQPIDTIRVRMVAQVGRESVKYRSFTSALIYHIKSKERIFCLWKGTRPALFSVMPYTSLQFMFVTMFQRVTDSSGVAGFFGGLCAKSMTYPLDVVKKRLQVQAQFKRVEMDGRTNYTGIYDCARDLVRHDRGVLNLYRGASVALIKSGVTAGLVWSTYHAISRKIAEFSV